MYMLHVTLRLHVTQYAGCPVRLYPLYTIRHMQQQAVLGAQWTVPAGNKGRELR